MKKEGFALTLLIVLMLGLAALFGAGLYLGLRAVGRLEVRLQSLEQQQQGLEARLQRQQSTLESSLQRQEALATAVARQQAEQQALRRAVDALARCTACPELG